MAATKQLIVTASVYQDDLERIQWICDHTGANRSQVVRHAILKLYETIHKETNGMPVRTYKIVAGALDPNSMTEEPSGEG